MAKRAILIPLCLLGADMDTIHRLFGDNSKIQRKVNRLANGVETLAESSDPKVRAMLQEHVHAMHARLRKEQPIRAWDPLFPRLAASGRG